MRDQAMELTVMSDATRQRLAEARFTCSEVGATVGQLPARYHHLRRRVTIGRRHQVYAEAAADVASWQVQLRARLTTARLRRMD